MNTFKLLAVLLIALSLQTLSPDSSASDLEKEKRWASQVVDAIIDGDAVWLNDGKSDFLGIYTEAGEDMGHAVIIMHGTGIHPNWQQVVQPLRVGLTEHNWNTLSIQMPILANDAEYADYAPLYDEVAPRIDAAIKYLKDHGSKYIVLIGHSQGSAMAAYYLSGLKQDDSTGIKGFAAIGMAAFAADARMDSIKSLEKIKLPVLDLYGTEDLDNILASVESRATAAKKAGNNNYTQTRIKGNHFFDGHESKLVETVAAWLEQLPAQ